MMKKKTFLFIIIITICSINYFLFLSQSTSIANTTLKLGIKGTLNGTPICHCPDDATNCWCHLSE